MQRSDEDLLTYAELAKYLGVSVRRLRQKVAERKCPEPLRLAGSTRWKWRTIREWTEAVDTLKRLGLVPDDDSEGGSFVPGDDDLGKSLTDTPAGSSGPKKAR